MLRFSALLIALTVVTAVSAVSQEAPGPERLRQQVMQRLLETYRAQAGLTPQQEVRFREVFQQSLRQRQESQRREQELWRALEGQMRPGFAANPDSLTKLMDGILAARGAHLDQIRAEQRDYATFLNPVQRAQLFIMWERFQRQVEQVQQRRRMEQRGPPPEGAF